MSVNDLVTSYYIQVDEFLRVQLDYSLGRGEYQPILDGHKNLISFLKECSFRDEGLEKARIANLDSLEGSVSHLYCQELSNLPTNEEGLVEFLNEARQSLDFNKYRPYLEDISMYEFRAVQAGSDSLEAMDLKVVNEINPFEFKEVLFEQTGFIEDERVYSFVEAPADKGFFMGAFNIESRYVIGHSKLDSLFNLSLLAHEIGHSTVPKQRDLEKAFIERISDDKFDFEMESYFYERVFLDNLSNITAELGISFLGDLKPEEALKKMRLRKYNGHLLRLNLVKLFLENKPLDEIRNFYSTSSRELGLFGDETHLAWSRFAQLHNPLSGLPFVKAFLKHFSDIV